ncbi:uncharacterized protein LOC128799083, partial [Vidua chalybeata]|uniref:uncharacterized protein LOC128799083 n=1 Tax=Vidua chalybeata TaxID=81927 RepID=UPI0023A8A021
LGQALIKGWLQRHSWTPAPFSSRLSHPQSRSLSPGLSGIRAELSSVPVPCTVSLTVPSSPNPWGCRAARLVPPLGLGFVPTLSPLTALGWAGASCQERAALVRAAVLLLGTSPSAPSPSHPIPIPSPSHPIPSHPIPSHPIPQTLSLPSWAQAGPGSSSPRSVPWLCLWGQGQAGPALGGAAGVLGIRECPAPAAWGGTFPAPPARGSSCGSCGSCSPPTLGAAVPPEPSPRALPAAKTRPPSLTALMENPELVPAFLGTAGHPSHPIPSHPIPSHPIPSTRLGVLRVVLSHPIPSHPIPSH